METFVCLHLERVAQLERNFQNKKARNEDLNQLLGRVGETVTNLE